MIELHHALSAWGTPEFERCFKAEVEALPAAVLPLQQALAYTACVSDEPFSVMLLNTSEDEETIQVKAGVFYSGIIGGCSCADDPTPNDTQREYCVLRFAIDKRSAATTLTLLPE